MNNTLVRFNVDISTILAAEELRSSVAMTLGILNKWEKDINSPYDEVPAWRNEQIRTLWMVEQNPDKMLFSICGKILPETIGVVTSAGSSSEEINKCVAHLLSKIPFVTVC